MSLFVNNVTGKTVTKMIIKRKLPCRTVPQEKGD